ncbi:unnamed protein product [Boreogadus saida]
MDTAIESVCCREVRGRSRASHASSSIQAAVITSHSLLLKCSHSVVDFLSYGPNLLADTRLELSYVSQCTHLSPPTSAHPPQPTADPPSVAGM